MTSNKNWTPQTTKEVATCLQEVEAMEAWVNQYGGNDRYLCNWWYTGRRVRLFFQKKIYQFCGLDFPNNFTITPFHCIAVRGKETRYITKEQAETANSIYYGTSRNCRAEAANYLRLLFLAWMKKNLTRKMKARTATMTKTTLPIFYGTLDARTREYTTATVARLVVGETTLYCVVGTEYGHLHTSSGGVRTWKTYSGARRVAATYQKARI